MAKKDTATQPNNAGRQQEIDVTKWRHWLIALLLAAVTLAVFWEVRGHDFVSWDDDTHVYRNPHYQPITIDSILQFWRVSYQGLYIPLSYTVWGVLAYIARLPEPLLNADGNLVGFDPQIFHTFNLALHIANVLLVFFLLRFLLHKTLNRDTDDARDTPIVRDWAAAAGAALFAIHPLQVEAVAWISELRGLLSAFFSLLALWCFVHWAAPVEESSAQTSRDRPMHPTSWRFALATLCYMLALLAKPGAVVLPLIAWIVDGVLFSSPVRRHAWGLGLWLVIAVLWSGGTKLAQPLNASFLPVPLWTRPFVAGDALAFYLAKLAVPLNLATDYGRTPQAIMQSGWGYITWLLPVTLGILLWRNRTRNRWLLVAAGVFVAALLPVLGLTPFAFQYFSTVADRYVYLAMLGPAMALAWLLSTYHHRVVQSVSILALCVFAGVAAFHTLYWSTSSILYTHTLGVNPRSHEMHNNLALIMWGKKNIKEAKEHFLQAISLKPNNERAHNNLGSLLESQGDIGEAIKHYRQALHYQPYYVPAHIHMGRALAANGNLKAAEEHFATAFRLEPNAAKPRYEWGICLERAGFLSEARKQYEAVLGIDPNHTQAQSALRRIQLRNWALKRVLKIEPKSSRSRPESAPRSDPGSQSGLLPQFRR